MAAHNETAPVTPEMLDAAGVARRLKRWVPLGASLAESWARERRILGIHTDRATVYPACQFDDAGLPFAGLRPVICALSPHMTSEQILDWLHAPCPALDGRAPRDVLKLDPQAAHAAAMASAAAAAKPASERRRVRPDVQDRAVRMSAKATSSPRRSRSAQ